MIEEFMEVILRDCKARRVEMEVNLGKGYARSFEDYQHRVGYLKGLSDAEEIVRQSRRKLHEDDEEAEDAVD